MAGLGGRQTSISVQPAPAVVGDFCDLNPRFSAIAGPGGFVAGPSGVVVGRFVWASNPLDPNSEPTQLNNFGAGPVTGIVANEQQALNSAYLADAGLTIPAGFGVTAYSGCGIWVKNAGATQALIGQKAYANVTTGAVSFAATGAPLAGGTSTSSTISAQTESFSGSIAGNVLTATGTVTGTIVPGATISGTGVATGTQIQSQLTPLLAGEALGGDGRYYVSIGEQTVASTTISGTYGLLTVGGTVAGTYAVNDVISGASVVAGTTITALGTGAGGAGTYIVNNNTVIASGQAINVASINVETKWFAMSSGLPGELVKMTSHPNG